MDFFKISSSDLLGIIRQESRRLGRSLECRELTYEEHEFYSLIPMFECGIVDLMFLRLKCQSYFAN